MNRVATASLADSAAEEYQSDADIADQLCAAAPNNVGVSFSSNAVHENDAKKCYPHKRSCVSFMVAPPCIRAGCPHEHRDGPRRHRWCCNACRLGNEYHTNNCSGRGRAVSAVGDDRRGREAVRLPSAWRLQVVLVLPSCACASNGTPIALE